MYFARKIRVEFNSKLHFTISTNIDIQMSKVKQFILGEAGRRSLYLSHAKRALYHLSYIPVVFG